MASSMLTAEVLSASATTEADVDKAFKSAVQSCANDPDFAVICDFLQKFSEDLGLDLPNFKLLLQWLTKTDEVSPQLKDMQIKLLRKTRKTVHEKSWESALSKFCFTYSAQDGWEIERFGYKNCSVKIKLRILRELLECQFERNTKFRSKILSLGADSLRSKPIGRDRQGHSYWVTQDNDCNIRIYQEHLDEEIWQVVATNREEFVNLIKRLRGSEVVQPCKDIGIVDEDTSCSSHMDSESIQKGLPPDEKDDSQEDEQKVPKLSIKLVHGKSLKETAKIKSLSKGEEDLAAEEDAKLLKKLNSCSEAIESGEEEFEEIEEEYDEENSSEVESEDENNEHKKHSKKNETVQKFNKNLKAKVENKKVEPLLISQNKVINNEKCLTFKNSGRKRAMDLMNCSPPSRSESQHVNSLKKSRPSLLDSKTLRTSNKYKDNEADNEDLADEDVEGEEEIEEEDIDSVAAEEDENEEKLFEDYDDDEEEKVGEEICDPIVLVTGHGSGKECDVENYLYCIDCDFDNDSVSTLSDVIIENVSYFHGEGYGKECLVGNDKVEDTVNIKANSLEASKTNVEQNLEIKTKISSPRNENSFVDHSDCIKLSASKKSASHEDILNNIKNVSDDLDTKKKENDECPDITPKKLSEIEKQETPKKEIDQINGEKKSNVNSKTENLDEEKSDTNKTKNLLSTCDTKTTQDAKDSEATCKEDYQSLSNNITTPNTDSVVVDMLIQQTHANKMFALESLKKELRESKQKLLEKKIPQTIESSSLNISSPANCNRKRRLTDQLQATVARPQNSESEVDFNSENTEDLANDKELEGMEQDVGGKRLKMRPKLANTELRKKIEAQKVAANDETTSSSGGEEEIMKRKKLILTKPNPLILISENEQNFIAKKANDNENLTEIDEKIISAVITKQSALLKKPVQVTPTKVKPTLAEIIEKKLKKTPEKVQSELCLTDNDNIMVEAASSKNVFPTLHKSPVTKPLKKNVLTQIRQGESEEDAVPRKRTNSQELNSAILSDVKSFGNLTKSSADTIAFKIGIEKTTIERQRKRRSSEETVQNDSPEEPEAKKEATVVGDNVRLNESTESNKEKNIKVESKDFEIQSESPVLVSGRRSGRRGKVIPIYVDTLQSKRNRGSNRSSIKIALPDCEKVESKSEQRHNVHEEICSANVKLDIADTTSRDKLSVDKSTSFSEDDPRKEDKIKKNTKSIQITNVDVSNPKSSLKTKIPAKGVRKQREVDAINIIDIDSETPVRQSRRIAQQKIREEAERRKLEEIALRTMKQELKKKKKAEKQADPTVVPPTEPSSESEESDVEIKKKVQKKKCPGKNGNWSSGSEEQEEPEDEDEEPPHYETDPGSPLFKSDHEFSPESDIEDESQVVPMKRARTVRKEDADENVTAPDEEEEACQKCNKSDHPEWILLCDNCDKGYHCSCLSPVLFYIPEGDWYCPPCQQEQLIKALENQLKEFDNLVENKKKAEEQEKRIAEEEEARIKREEETNKLTIKKDKRITSKRSIDNSSADNHSQEEDDDEGAVMNSDGSKDSDSINANKNKNRNRSRKFRNNDKRNHWDRRHNATRSRRNRLQKFGSESDSDSQRSSISKSGSKSSSSSSSTYSESDNEPIYKLRKRRQINVSYRLNEYDDLINSALKKEMDQAAGAGNLGRGKDISTIIEADKEEKARQKQTEGSEIVKQNKLDNEESVKETKKNSINIELNDTNNDEKKEVEQEENESDAEPIVRKLLIKQSQKKKSRKLTTLDISSEDDDGSDEDFKGSSFDDEEDDEEDSSISASNSDSSLEIYKRHGKLKKKSRKAARRAYRERRRDRKFLVDESDDEELQRPKSKKKRQDDSDYTESEADDDISELSENIDSADLCDDTTTDESDGAWRPNKRKKAKKSSTPCAQKSPKFKGPHTKKPKKVEYSDDDVSESEEDEDDENEEIGSGKGMGKQPRTQPLKNSSSSKIKGKGKEKPPSKTKKKNSSDNESSQSDSEDSTRRTRGRRYAYIEDFDDDSSDGGIKPGVQRPDTPPEEREKFIKRQEEIKRMLAEKNAEGAKLVATPRLTPIKTDGETDKRSPAKAGGDSLSTVPLSVIRQAKVLDIDYLQRRGENLDDLSNEVGEVNDDFDDADLPDDLPEDMDEDAIARMVEEEEEFGVAAAKELPAPDEVLRASTTIKSTKTKEIEKPIHVGSTSSSLPTNSSQVSPISLPTPVSGLQEPVRKRLPMPTIHPPLLRHQYLMHDSMPNTQHLMQRHAGTPTSHLLQNALSAPLTQPLDRSYPSTTSSAPHHSLINRMAHNIPLQPTVPHVLSTTRTSQELTSSIVTKLSPTLDQSMQLKITNPSIITESKPRGRRKKITPLRDTLQKQQTAAAVTAATATSSALGSSSVKNNDNVSTPLLSSVIKVGSTPKAPMQTSVITSMPQISHSAASRPGVPMPSVSGSYVRTDGPTFYDTLGSRISQTVQRHRGPPQMPPSLLPPHPANRSSYGLPPPLKGSNPIVPVSSPSNTSGSIRNPIRHIPTPYLGMPPNARHASHINMYRPPMFGNPNFGPRVNLRPSNIHSPDYSPGSRAYSPYGFYPPPPPLTTPSQRSGSGSIPQPSSQMPPIQSTLTHPPASVIVSTTSSKSSIGQMVTVQPTPSPTLELTNPSSKSEIVTQESSVRIASPKMISPTPVITQTRKPVTSALPVAEPRKQLTTLQAYTTSNSKKSPMLLASDSSVSRSPPISTAEVNDDSSAPETSESTPTAEQPTRQEGGASEFSGLVSYFSSQHDDYNT